MLHIGDYDKELYETFRKLRENEKIETFNGKLELALKSKDWVAVLMMLESRPGVFARSLARLLTVPTVIEPEKNAFSKLSELKKVINNDIPYHNITDSFANVVDKVPTRNLTQLWGSIRTRKEDVYNRVVFPKGSVAKAYSVKKKLNFIPAEFIDKIVDLITVSLTKRFASGKDLGKVWLDPELKQCPLPTGMRSASEALREVARGTRMDIGNKKVLRFFCYWKGQDIDLSGTFLDENFKEITSITYYNLKDGKACHSGDILSAPNGASEFIDIDIKSAIEDQHARYALMSVLVFSGPTFAEHEECFAGWMTRDNVGSNEVYEPKTVQNKIDMRSETKRAIPVLFDLKERKAIWVDITMGNRRGTFNTMANNVESNKASIQETAEAFCNLNNKISLYELFELHAKARGEIVEDIRDADTVFSAEELDTDLTVVTPFDITTINGFFLI